MKLIENSNDSFINANLLFQNNLEIIKNFKKKIWDVLLLDGNNITDQITYINKLISICYRTWFVSEWLEIWNNLFQSITPKYFENLSLLELTIILEDLVSNFDYYIEKQLWKDFNIKHRLKSPFSIKVKLDKINNVNDTITKKEILERFDDLIWIKILVDTDIFFDWIDKIIERIFLDKLWIKLQLKKDFILSNTINPPKIPMKNYSWNYKDIWLQVQMLDKNFENAFYSSTYFIHKWFNIDNLQYDSLNDLYIRILYFYILNQKWLDNKDKLLLELWSIKKIHYFSNVIWEVLTFDYNKNIKKLYNSTFDI